jgi:hypothetical protein
MQRVASRAPALQTPPLGTELVDKDAVAVLQRWIEELEKSQKVAHQEESGR